MRALRLATRASDLALVQARHVAGLLQAALGVSAELVPLKTTGDRLQSVSLAKVGGKGLFVKEIEEALLAGRADLAVHSAKDLPAVLAPQLALLAFPERADPRDALVGRASGATLDGLARGARVGTGSVRRGAQLRALRPDLEVVPLRGNVPTRLRRLEERDLDAVVLACAGLDRLGLSHRIDERLPPARMLPAVAQGALALQGRRDDPATREVARLDHGPTAARVAAERGLLERLGADCTVPLAALAEVEGERLHLRALLAAPAGDRIVRADGEGAASDATRLGRRVADDLLSRGAQGLLDEIREAAS
jgi:hydroxymethylbilane synthase